MIGILILNYKKYQVTASCIRSVLDTGSMFLTIISMCWITAPAMTLLPPYKPNFQTIPASPGWKARRTPATPRGNNQMLSRARKDGCTAAVITNSDIVFLPGTFQQLLRTSLKGTPL